MSLVLLFFPFIVVSMKFLATLVILVVSAVAMANQRALEGCPDKCGNVTIPYPFGVGKGCYYISKGDTHSDFEITCSQGSHRTHKHGPPRPMFGNKEVQDIALSEGEITLVSLVSHDCYDKNGNITFSNGPVELDTGVFTISTTKNFFAAIGCDTYSTYKGTRRNRSYHTGCMSVCDREQDVSYGPCSGAGCCRVQIPTDVSNIKFEALSFNNHTQVSSFNPCSSAFVAAKYASNFSRENLSRVPHKTQKVPVILEWMIGTENCSIAQANGNYLCKENSWCHDSTLENGGYLCKCLDGYSGNPYLRDGCTDIDECKMPNKCEKAKYCINTNGGYYCKCPKGNLGNGTITDRCISNKKERLMLVLFAGTVAVNIALFVIGFLLYRKHGKRKLKKMRESFFRQNGGLLLHEKLLGQDEGMLKIFSVQDLRIATDNYSETNIIGRGGFGIVYKGTLPNNQLVAIKKSIKVGPNQVEQFINEVLVLSKINNRNVVKLIGCCLEVEVPLLVYEYIGNGTLYDHLHKAVAQSTLTWNMRLKIASEVADVLSYLHNTISPRIIHRDMKSMNILLDESYTTKVSDFGSSRLFPLDQDQLATMVEGTWGYLDPEYMQTSDLTEKSDVYSFGVVLVELLTRKKAISYLRPETERNLAMHFLLNMREGRLLDILDKNIVNEGTIDQMQQVANIAKGCLMLKGEDRPTMKEVAIELETIERRGSHPWINNEKSFHEDCEAFVEGNSRSGASGWSSGIDSKLYDLHPSFGSGR